MNWKWFCHRFYCRFSMILPFFKKKKDYLNYGNYMFESITCLNFSLDMVYEVYWALFYQIMFLNAPKDKIVKHINSVFTCDLYSPKLGYLFLFWIFKSTSNLCNLWHFIPFSVCKKMLHPTFDLQMRALGFF